MPTFQSNPVKPSRTSTLLRKHPSLFGVPFIVMMVAASFGLAQFTQTRYDLQDQKVTQASYLLLAHRSSSFTHISQVTKEQALGLKANRKKFDIREEYFKLSSSGDEDWEPKRIQRPKGLPEWGVPPSEPPQRKDT
ncbi:hypothetical protein PUNSTDRAFT_71377 [Punctularia strigosozonata HHB-11173 SS5]|uniref:uncharacterized protein n=1 Tax=Punctularia strigosozonata (strain HHB-11173) TaxID=741275 RepID=UPI0004416CBC|nr:uncharacterized protein PUNSTDRAFT_71377 [Punctularia strigosozonata HHB-11173 SS5]EIN07033.1 hypothetical protein PUNSTDRAFT_71377 [Punctularia strigosozonata HHB-11173 SS5]